MAMPAVITTQPPSRVEKRTKLEPHTTAKQYLTRIAPALFYYATATLLDEDGAPVHGFLQGLPLAVAVYKDIIAEGRLVELVYEFDNLAITRSGFYRLRLDFNATSDVSGETTLLDRRETNWIQVRDHSIPQ